MEAFPVDTTPTEQPVYDPELDREIVNPTHNSNWILTSPSDKVGLIVGSHPLNDKRDIHRLLSAGVNVFVNLCDKGEKNRLGHYEDIVKEVNPEAIIIDFPMTSKLPTEDILYGSTSKIFDRILFMNSLVYVHDANGESRANLYSAYVAMMDKNITSTAMMIDIIRLSNNTRQNKPKTLSFSKAAEYQLLRAFNRIHAYNIDIKKKQQLDQMKSIIKREEELKKRRGEKMEGELVIDAAELIDLPK